MIPSSLVFLSFRSWSPWQPGACRILGLILLPFVLDVDAARAGLPSPVLRIVGQADVSGRDIFGTQFPLGTGPFTLDLTVPNPTKLPTSQPGQDDFSSAFSDFSLDAPASGFPRGGQTIQNFILAGREGEPNADFFNFGVFDCSTNSCSFPIGSIGNASEALGFQSIFGNALLPDGTLGQNAFSDLNEFLTFLDALDFATASATFFNASWIPESLLPPVVGAGGNGGADIRFVSVDGTISDVIYPAPPIGGLTADLDADTDVDGRDLLLIQRTDPSLIPAWETEYGTGVGPLASSRVIPEPATSILLLTAGTFGRRVRIRGRRQII